jgi:cytochrome P450/NADPH-cytochrome P450 reductase
MELKLVSRHRLYHDREEVVETFRNGARIYVCGRSAIATAAKETCTKLYQEISGKSEEDSEAWFESIKSDRFAVDVFT